MTTVPVEILARSRRAAGQMAREERAWSRGVLRGECTAGWFTTERPLVRGCPRRVGLCGTEAQEEHGLGLDWMRKGWVLG